MSTEFIPELFAVNKGREIRGPRMEEIPHDLATKIEDCDVKDIWGRLNLYKDWLRSCPLPFTEEESKEEEYREKDLRFLEEFIRDWEHDSKLYIKIYQI